MNGSKPSTSAGERGRGDGLAVRVGGETRVTRFNGLPDSAETVETVHGLPPSSITPLKRGVNEMGSYSRKCLPDEFGTSQSPTTGSKANGSRKLGETHPS